MSLKESITRHRFPFRLSVLLLSCATAVVFTTAGVLAQRNARRISGGSSRSGVTEKTSRSINKTRSGLNRTSSGSNVQDPVTGQTVGTPTIGETGIQRTTAEIMQAQAVAPPSSRPPVKPEREVAGHDDRPQNPDANPVASWPDLGAEAIRPTGNEVVTATQSQSAFAPQTVSTNFDTVTGPTETGAFPPDTMGAVGPSQFFLFVNGRLRTFTKGGVAGAVVNADPDVFFASVMTPVSPPVVLNFTSDPQVRYDRLSARWFLSIIDVPCTVANCTTTAAKRTRVASTSGAIRCSSVAMTRAVKR